MQYLRLVFIFILLLFFVDSAYADNNESNFDKALNSTFKLEILELVFNANEKVGALKSDGITDAEITNLLNEIKLKAKTENLDDIVAILKNKYRNDNEKLNKILSFISPNPSRSHFYEDEYLSIKSLYEQIDQRISYINEIKRLLDFISNEVSKYENDTTWINEDDKKELAIAINDFRAEKLDLSREELINIKVKLDLRGILQLKKGQDIINRLKSDRFNTTLLQDLYDSAEDELENAYFKYVLESEDVLENSSIQLFVLDLMSKVDYKEELSYEEIDYPSIKSIVINIEYISNQIDRINKNIKEVREKSDEYKKLGINSSVADKDLEKAIEAFDQERYDEAELLLSKANSNLEMEHTRMSVTNVLAKESVNLINKYKYTFILITLSILIFGPILIRRFRIYLTKKKINELYLEQEVLLNLLKKAQIERYKEGVIDHAIYQIKLDQYTEKISTIKSKLPVVNNILERLSKNPTFIEKIFIGTKNFIYKPRRRKNKKNKNITKVSKTPEYFRYRKKEFLFLGILIVIWALISLILAPSYTLVKFMIAFSIMAFFITLTALLIRKFGIVLLIMLLAVAIINSLPDLGGLGIKAYLIMLISGLFFELIYLLLNLKNKLIPFNVITSVCVSLAFIPLWTGLLLSIKIVLTRKIDIINLMLIDFFLSMIGALFAFMLWFYFRTSKLIVKFENEL